MVAALDKLTIVINVHWGGAGAVFVIGDDDGRYWRCTVRSKRSEPVFVKIGEIGPLPGIFNCSSYARTGDGETPTFILGGGDRDGAAILVSHDSIDWTRASWDLAKTPVEFVWDSTTGLFYLWAPYRTPDMPGVDGQWFSECWASSDGYTWSIISSLGGFVRNPDFEVHCEYKWSAATIRAGKGFADGKFGFDPKYDSGNGLLMTVESLDDTYVDAVSFAGKIWAKGGTGGPPAIGNGILEISVDDGETWTVVGQVEQPSSGVTHINTICAAPFRDVSAALNARL